MYNSIHPSIHLFIYLSIYLAISVHLSITPCRKTFTFCSLLTTCTIPCACHAKRHLNVQKWSEPLVFFNILTSKCASHHNGVHFFAIPNAKSGPLLWCFVHFHFQMCFAPQRRAIFHLSIWPPAALASLLFDPPEPQIIGKNSVSRLSYLFAHLHLLSSDSFSSTLLSSNLLFSLPLPCSALSEV